MRISIVYGILAALITSVAMYLDSKLFDSPKTKSTYFKNMLFVGCLVGFGIYLIGETKFEKTVGFGFRTPQGGRGGYLGGIREEIMTGVPDF